MSEFSELRCEIEPDYVLSDDEKLMTHEALSSISVNPYRQYNAFKYQVGQLVENGRIPKNLVDLFADFSEKDHKLNPFLFVRNLPIDIDVPAFDNDRAVFSKYELKKTFIGEACLSFFGHSTNQTPVGYMNVNDGDVFQDIFPIRSMSQTQSQKALGPIYFHKDLANHYVRPDFVNMLSMRGSVENEIYTTFVRNLDVIAELSDEELTDMRKTQFYTPFDDMTTLSSKFEVGKAKMHPLISGDCDIRFFENRTVGTDDKTNALVERLNAVLHQVKRSVQMCPGDLISVENNYSVHGKEVGKVRSEEEAWRRWTMKTVNVKSIIPHKQHLAAGSDYLIAG